MWIFSLFSNRRNQAGSELRAEFRQFSYDGLVELERDLEARQVKRGTWDGCVLSYRRGAPGSVDCDRKGRRGNAFTRFWDAERMNEREVLAAVRDELEARRSRARTPRTRRRSPETSTSPASRPSTDGPTTGSSAASLSAG